MKLSIIIPCYNCAERINKLLMQIYPQVEDNDNVEVILVNDGSTDNTKDVISAFLQNNDSNKFLLITTQNKGAAAAREKGLEFATGEYVFFCDSDDLISHKFVQTILSVCETCADVIYFSSEIISSGQNYHKIADKVLFEDNISFTSPDDFLLHQLKHGYWTAAVWTYVFKRSIAVSQHITFSSRRAHEDHLFTAKIILNAKQIICLKDTLYFQILTLGSLTNSKKNLRYISERYLSFVQARELLKGRCKKKTIFHYEIWSLRSIISLFLENRSILLNAMFSYPVWKAAFAERTLIYKFAFFIFKNK
ncbi:TPA: glycosyltransferase, partial [Klebsiella pneumoniae]|nr:glycosyltransferase [Klebsiella pneumoniae]